MTRRRAQRGGALIEFAMVLPFSVMLFLGIGDFGAYFWQQVRMEEVARFAITRVGTAHFGHAGASEETLYFYGRLLERQVRQDSGIPEVSVSLSRHYACPLSNGGEKNLTDQPQLCEQERVYLLIASGRAVSPLLQPLRLMGYPETAISRHYLRVR